MTEKHDTILQQSFTKVFVTEIVAQKTSMKRTVMEEKLTKQVFNWLQPHHLRTTAYTKFVGTEVQ